MLFEKGHECKKQQGKSNKCCMGSKGLEELKSNQTKEKLLLVLRKGLEKRKEKGHLMEVETRWI